MNQKNWTQALYVTLTNFFQQITFQTNTMLGGTAKQISIVGTTLTISLPQHHVLGTGSVDTISLSSVYGFTGPVWFIADSVGGFTFVPGVSIARALSIPQNAAACLIFDGKLWYPVI